MWRSGCIGPHALHHHWQHPDRLYRAMAAVVADNHIGDWAPTRKLIVAWDEWLDAAAFESDAIGELERLYVKFGDEADEAMQDRARSETAKLQAGDERNNSLWRKFIDVSMVEFERVYARLGVSFDEVLGESFYNPVLPDVVTSLKKKGIGEDSEGAVVVRWDEDGPKGLANTVLVIQKQDGAYLYGTTDLATLQHRKNTWNPKEWCTSPIHANFIFVRYLMHGSRVLITEWTWCTPGLACWSCQREP